MRNIPVLFPYLVRPVIEVGVDDGLRFAVKHLIGDHAGIAHDHVNHRVVIGEVIEADHSTIGVTQVIQEHVQLLTLVAPRRDNESPARTVGDTSDYDREEITETFYVITVVGVFTGHHHTTIPARNKTVSTGKANIMTSNLINISHPAYTDEVRTISPTMTQKRTESPCRFHNNFSADGFLVFT